MRPSIHNIRSLPNFTQGFRWNVAFISAPNAVAFPGNDAINWRAMSTSYPKKDPNITEISVRGQKIGETGRGTYSNSIVLTLYETVDNVVSEFIQSWSDACWSISDSETGVSLDKVDLEASIQLTRLNNKDVPIYIYDLYGCLLQTYEVGGDGTEEDDTPLKPAMTIWYDYYKGYKV